jgi:hypothetical protein
MKNSTIEGLKHSVVTGVDSALRSELIRNRPGKRMRSQLAAELRCALEEPLPYEELEAMAAEMLERENDYAY